MKANEEKLFKILSKRPNLLRFEQDSLLADNSSAIGLELEFENIYSNDLGEDPVNPSSIYYEGVSTSPHEFTKALNELDGYWYSVKDGSLRKGLEFIFVDGLKGANISEALKRMSAFIEVYKKNGNTVTITERCSTHVHLDVSDISLKELNNLLLIYILVERILFAHINVARIKNNYCRPLINSSFFKFLNKINRLEYFNGGTLISLIRENCDKYSALNLLPITRYGSIEFRHHPGSTDMSNILDWINIILTIKKLAVSYSVEDIIKEVNNKGILALIELFGNTTLTQIANNPLYIKELYDQGCTDVKEILQYNELFELTYNRKSSRKRPVNTLFFKFKQANGVG